MLLCIININIKILKTLIVKKKFYPKSIFDNCIFCCSFRAMKYDVSSILTGVGTNGGTSFKRFSQSIFENNSVEDLKSEPESLSFWSIAINPSIASNASLDSVWSPDGHSRSTN